MTTAQSVPEVPASEVPDGGWLLDVREPYEWAAGHVPTATHIPLAQLNHRADEIPKDDTVYVICRSGMRSARVVLALAAGRLAGGQRRRRHAGLGRGGPADGQRLRRRSDRGLTRAGSPARGARAAAGRLSAARGA